MASAITGCGGKGSSSDNMESSSADSSTEQNAETDAAENNTTVAQENTSEETKSSVDPTNPTEASTEAPTEHVSPKETLSAQIGTQVTLNKTISFKEGANTIKLPLADFIEEDDKIESFTFIIYSGDGKNIGQFKGGCGISVNSECAAATDEGWYQSENFTAPTKGTYGEITWNVPGEIKDYITSSGELLFGYWWGDASSIRIENVICKYSRTREISVDGTADKSIGKSVSYSADDNTIKVPTAGLIPDNAVPEAVVYNISSSGSLGKFTGAFGYNSSKGHFQSADTAVLTDSSNLSLTWFVPAQAKAYADKSGELILGYWWSEQPSIKLDSVSVKYSTPDGSKTITAKPEVTTKAPEKENNKDKQDPTKAPSSDGGNKKPSVTTNTQKPQPTTEAPTKAPSKPSSGNTQKPSSTTSSFRSSSEIVKSIKVGWCLGNSLDSYNTGTSGLNTETGWGNPKTTKAMIKSVKDKGFNAIRIPITWGEHMNGDKISDEWMARVKEVVDYAYSQGMYVIVNMHHDDYIWFNPTESEYSGDSAKLKNIWKQVAGCFKNYGDRLLFEGMNEPRSVGSANEWMGGTAPERAVINKYENDFVKTVRSTGGNNSKRTLIITSYAASAETSAINDVVVPADKNIILSVHYYAPWRFSGGQVKDFDANGKSELDAKFAELKQKFIDKGTPVIIGEFGCINAASVSTRQEYYRYYVSSAKKHGIKCFAWDNNILSGEESYGLLDRNSLQWKDGLADAMIQGAK